MQLRDYQPADEGPLLEICRRTGYCGGDATGVFADPDLVGLVFATPYAAFDPSLCLVLEDAQGPCGYVVGAADTVAYVRWFNTHWLLILQRDYGQKFLPPEAPDAWLYEQVRAGLEVPRYADAYPAHLHIDLLPRAQRLGWGRRMIEAWAARASARGACGLHLGVAAANTNAVAFYTRVGLEPIHRTPSTIVFAHELPWRRDAAAGGR